jgi:hypothetical protein
MDVILIVLILVLGINQFAAMRLQPRQDPRAPGGDTRDAALPALFAFYRPFPPGGPYPDEEP